MISTKSWGRQSGRTDKQWRLALHPQGVLVTAGGRSGKFVGGDLKRLSTRRHWFRRALVIDGSPPQRLTGLSRQEAAEIDAALRSLRARHHAENARRWAHRVWTLADEALEKGRWIPREAVDSLGAAHPGHDAVTALRRSPDMMGALSDEDRRAVDFLSVNLPAWIGEINERILAEERRRHADFFNNVEIRPLTDEQTRAVIAMDNRVHVIAAAGSGKTSVMVARAAYAIMRGFVRPDEVLLLAFNRDAAAELRSRVAVRLDVLGLPSEGLTATTFHAFGLTAIGEATGSKPRVAPWVADGNDLAMVGRIVDELRDSSPTFAFRWDLFRLLYSRPTESPDSGEPDGYDRETRETGFRTARNEVVRSEGERIIADWLFYNGVDCAYERPYDVDVADERHSQYRPDFYYPQIGVWHEHWALDANGQPPAHFRGYAESMEWKRNLHRQHGTTLIETTWAEIIDMSGLEQLGDTLTGLGIELDWNPNREAPGPRPLRHEDVARLMRTFMTHVKSNSLTRQDVARRLAERGSPGGTPRARLFLDLYWQLHEEWEKRLRAEDCVDFEDMLVQAAAHLERGDVDFGHVLVMVDEFQDASQARARLTRGMVRHEGRYLLAVGDDWQSINRFAGADISVMTQFEQWFGAGPTLRLQTTFRCPQSICDVASKFVSKNPRQLPKKVTSARADPGAGVTLLHVADPTDTKQAIGDYLKGLAVRLASGEEATPNGRPVSVFVLGRYRFDRDLVPRGRWHGLHVEFRTAHGSKGLEADYVIAPNLTRGRYGFPSNIQDDPVLNLVMADPDEFDHAEERRLFYVALTRARREVVLVAVAGQESPFVVELLEEQSLRVRSKEGPHLLRVCPECREGTLVVRTGRFGKFWGCSNFPACRYTESYEEEGPAPERPPF